LRILLRATENNTSSGCISSGTGDVVWQPYSSIRLLLKLVIICGYYIM